MNNLLRKWRTAAGLAAGALLVMIGLLGCSTAKDYKWLSFFFDGVPNPNARTNAIVATAGVGSTNKAPVVARPVSSLITHPPYGDKACLECHESKFSVRMKGTQRQVCFACHDDFLAKAKVKHAPAENSECTACHEPHFSPNKNLLLRTGRTLCTECHDDPLAKAKVKHSPVESGCLECQSPHASTNKFLVKKAGKAL